MYTDYYRLFITIFILWQQEKKAAQEASLFLLFMLISLNILSAHPKLLSDQPNSQCNEVTSQNHKNINDAPVWYTIPPSIIIHNHWFHYKCAAEVSGESHLLQRLLLFSGEWRQAELRGCALSILHHQSLASLHRAQASVRPDDCELQRNCTFTLDNFLTAFKTI